MLPFNLEFIQILKRTSSEEMAGHSTNVHHLRGIQMVKMLLISTHNKLRNATSH